MSRHLSVDEIAELIALGEQNTETERHLAECTLCRDEVNSFRTQVLAFREDVHMRAAGLPPSHALTVRRFFNLPYPLLLNATGAIAMACLVCLLSVVPGRQQPASVPVVALETSIDDTALLDSVRQDLSETAPSPLAAINSVSWRRNRGTAIR